MCATSTVRIDTDTDTDTTTLDLQYYFIRSYGIETYFNKTLHMNNKQVTHTHTHTHTHVT